MKDDIPVRPLLFSFRIQNRLKISIKSSSTSGVEAKPEDGQIVVQGFYRIKCRFNRNNAAFIGNLCLLCYGDTATKQALLPAVFDPMIFFANKKITEKPASRARFRSSRVIKETLVKAGVELTSRRHS